ncbi:MAG: nucleoside:proton symporter [Rhodospirillales bacterium]|nr:nucleoside:proton symporter [Rhodospirillales bacterium]
MAWQSVFGVVALTALAWLLGEKRRMPPWRVIAAGLGLQFALALVLLFLPPVKAMFLVLNRAVAALQEATMAGTAFVFGYLGGGPLPYAETAPGASFVLAFQALPLVLVMSALSALFFYWRILPLVVRAFAWALERTLGVGGAVGVSAAANVFVGMVEAPLLVRPYLRGLSRGELFVVMTCGMASIAGTVLALYAAFLARVIPDAVGHLLIASLISAPAAIMVSQLMVPHEGPPTPGDLAPSEDAAGTAMDAITRGTVDGIGLLINIVAMLVVLVALVTLLNQALALLPAVGGMPIALERILGLAMAPVAWAMGVPWAEAQVAGHLLGVKTVLNELIAYLQLSRLPEGALSERSALIMTYALCGFANFGSLGIMIGGLAGMVPERRAEIVGLGLKSLVSGTIATCLTGAVIGVLV